MKEYWTFITLLSLHYDGTREHHPPIYSHTHNPHPPTVWYIVSSYTEFYISTLFNFSFHRDVNTKITGVISLSNVFVTSNLEKFMKVYKRYKVKYRNLVRTSVNLSILIQTIKSTSLSECFLYAEHLHCLVTVCLRVLGSKHKQRGSSHEDLESVIRDP